jgi:hypothetical protein
MDWTSVSHRPALRCGQRMARPGPVSVLVAAISDRNVMLCADGIHVSRAGVRLDDRKVFRGPHLVTGMVGAIDAPAGSIGSAVAAATGAPAIADFITALQVGTRGWLTAAYQQWRTAVGPGVPVEAFATVVVGGHEHGRPTAVELTVALDGAGQLQWTLPSPLPGLPGEAFIGAWGATDEQLLAATTVYPQAVRLGILPGRFPPAARPSAHISDQDLFQHVRDLVTNAIVREPALPRPWTWPSGVPVIGGRIQTVAL